MTKRLLTLLCLMWVFYPKDSAQNPERLLFDDHFSTLTTTARPSIVANTPVNVTVDLAFAKIGPLDLKAGSVKFIIWLRMYWEDKSLVWDPLKYKNYSSIVVPYSTVWHPDIIVYNSAEKAREIAVTREGSLEVNTKVNSDGTVFLGTLATITTFCQGNIEFFPYDDQECRMTMGTWSHDRRQIDLFLKPKINGDGIDLSNYDNSTEWELLGITAIKQVTSYGSGEHVDLQYTVRLRRMPLYYVVNYTLPTMIIASVAMLVFLIPPEVGKRMEAGINLLLCLSVYLLLVNSKVPNLSTSFPMLTKFYGSTIIILVVSMCCSCWVYSLYFMNPNGYEIYQMNPSFKVFLFDWLGPLLKFPNLGDHKNNILLVTEENKLETDGKPNGCNHTQSQRNSETKKINGKADDGTETRSSEKTKTFYENEKLDKDFNRRRRRYVSDDLRPLGEQNLRDQAHIAQDKQRDSLKNEKESNKLFRHCKNVLPGDPTKNTMDARTISVDKPRDGLNSRRNSIPGNRDTEQTCDRNNNSRGKQKRKEDSKDKTSAFLPNDGGKARKSVGKTEETTEERTKQERNRYKGGKRETKESQDADKEKKRSNKVKPEKEPKSNVSERKRSRRDNVSNSLESLFSPRDARSSRRKTSNSFLEVEKGNQASRKKPKRRTTNTGLLITPELTIKINTDRKIELKKSRDETDRKTSCSEVEKSYQVNKTKPKRISTSTSFVITPGLAAEINADRKIELKRSRGAVGKNTSQRNPANKTCSEEQFTVDGQEKSVSPVLVFVSGSTANIRENSNFDTRCSESHQTTPSSVNENITPSLQEEKEYQHKLLQYLSHASENERMKEKNIQEWKRAANILNRLFLLLMFTSIVVSFFASFLASPRVREKFKV